MSRDMQITKVEDRRAATDAIGANVAGALTAQEALQTAGLGFNVEKIQLRHPREDSPILAWGTFRSDNGAFLGTVGRDYEIIQTADVLDLGDAVMGIEAGAHWDTLGVLDGGRKFWGQTTLPHGLTVGGSGNDQIATRLLVASSHEGSMATTVKVTLIRAICRNTLSAALRDKQGRGIRIKHTRNALERLEQAKRVLAGTQATIENIQERLELLANRMLRREDVESIFARLFPLPKKADAKEGEEQAESGTRRNNVIRDILDLYEWNDGANGNGEIRGTALNMLNAVIEYTDHMRGVRLTEQRGDMTVEQARAENAAFGTGAALKERALDIILQSTELSPAKPYRTYIQRAFDNGAMLRAQEARAVQVMEIEPEAPKAGGNGGNGPSVLDMILAGMN